MGLAQMLAWMASADAGKDGIYRATLAVLSVTKALACAGSLRVLQQSDLERYLNSWVSIRGFIRG